MTQQTKTDIKPSLATKMVEALVKAKIYGNRACLGEGDIHHDGRKRKPLARSLINEGYIEDTDTSKYSTYSITDKILNEAESSKPDLIAIVKERPEMNRLYDGYTVYDYQESVRLADLSQAEKVYVVTHPEEFTFSAFDFGRRTHFEFGKGNETLDVFRGNTMCISTPEYLAFVEKVDFGVRVKRTMHSNLAHGLRKLCGVLERDTDYLEVTRKSIEEDNDYVLADGPPAFTEESEAWGGIMSKNADACRKAIAFATCKLDAINRIEKQVALYGGWDKFRADLEKMVIEAIGKEEEEEANAQA